MKKPKKVKTWLKMLLTIADSAVGYDLNDSDKLTEEEQFLLNSAIAALQNSLGDELAPILEKYGLKWSK